MLLHHCIFLIAACPCRTHGTQFSVSARMGSGLKPFVAVQAMLTAFRAGNAVHMPMLKAHLEHRCAGARVSALMVELAAASAQAFPA